MTTHGSSPCPGSERLTHLNDPSGCEYVTACVVGPRAGKGAACLGPVYPAESTAAASDGTTDGPIPEDSRK
jgi:hypothetical protein